MWRFDHTTKRDSSHYSDVIMGAIASQITRVSIVCSTVISGAYKKQSPESVAFVWEIYRWPVDSPQKGPGTRKMFPFDDIIMVKIALVSSLLHPLTIDSQTTTSRNLMLMAIAIAFYVTKQLKFNVISLISIFKNSMVSRGNPIHHCYCIFYQRDISICPYPKYTCIHCIFTVFLLTCL